MSNLEKIAKLKILSIEDNEDGTSTLNFDLDDDFIEWFKDTQGLKRFSHKRFQKFIREAISNTSGKGVVGRVFADRK